MIPSWSPPESLARIMCLLDRGGQGDCPDYYATEKAGKPELTEEKSGADPGDEEPAGDCEAR